VKFGKNIFAAHVVTVSECVFCKGRDEKEEKFEHVRWSLGLPGVSRFCPPPPPFLSAIVYTAACFAIC
jgi:hypothetical protein